jgi:hypothetical protein
VPNRKEAKGRTPLILAAYRYGTWHTEAAAKGAATHLRVATVKFLCIYAGVQDNATRLFY